MNRKELKKVNGDLFFEAERDVGNNYIYVNWVGIQSIETIMMGANSILTMLQEKACPDILNSNKELIGPWNDGALYLGSSWAPRAKLLGVKNFAHVLAPGIYGIRSFNTFYQIAQNYFQIESFTTESEAKDWLLF